MADVLIRGMEMPEYCYECPLSNAEGGYCQFYKDSYRWSYERPASCPLVFLPEGHGRLIDADALAERCDSPNWCVWLNEIQDVPTIVPAEGDGKNG